MFILFGYVFEVQARFVDFVLRVELIVLFRFVAALLGRFRVVAEAKTNLIALSIVVVLVFRLVLVTRLAVLVVPETNLIVVINSVLAVGKEVSRRSCTDRGSSSSCPQGA